MLERYSVIGGHLRLSQDGTVTSYADAQATIAALQQRVAQLESGCEVCRKRYDNLSTQYSTLQADHATLMGQLTKWEEIASLRFAGDHKFVKEMELLKVENNALQQRVVQLEGERDKYRSVLEGAEYQELDRLLTEPIENCRRVGELAAHRTKVIQADHATLLGLVRETVQFFESNFENAGLELCGLMGGRDITHTGQRLNELIEQLAASLPAQPAQGGA